MKLSGVVIAKNEEDMIADCLDSLSFCDEIIVVDNGSMDRTVEIAERMGAQVISSQTDDFSEMRNLGLSKAKGEWVLYVDADERISSALAKEIQFKIQPFDSAQGKSSEFKIYRLRRKNFYLGFSMKNEWPYIERLERLFNREKLKGWKGKLHESPVVEGAVVGQLDGFLLHYTHRDLASMLNKTIEWSKIEAELRLKVNHPKMTWWRFLRIMITSFLNSYIRQGGWKVGTMGLIESIYQSFSTFITYARLWEMQNKKN